MDDKTTTLALAILKMAGVETKEPGGAGWEEFRHKWHLNEQGEGSGFVVPNAKTQNAYLAVGPSPNIVTVDVFFDRMTDAHLWSRWGTDFATWCNENWMAALARPSTKIKRGV